MRNCFFLTLVALLFIGRHLGYSQNLSPAGIYSDHMVLQRGAPLVIYGQAVPGANGTVKLADREQSFLSDSVGHWEVSFKPFQASMKPVEMVIESNGEQVHFKDVLFGDVWLASGQSNMEFKLRQGVLKQEEAIATADEKGAIRYFEMDKAPASQPGSHISGKGWQVSSHETVPDFSAVAYFFAQRLHDRLSVPIGIIDATWGGSSIEAWMSPESLETLPHLLGPKIPGVENGEYNLSEYHELNNKNIASVLDITANSFKALDAGVLGRKFNDNDWELADTLVGWQTDDRQVYWFRKQFDMPSTGKDSLILNLGIPGDRMYVYLNGEEIGIAQNKKASFKLAADKVKATWKCAGFPPRQSMVGAPFERQGV